MNIIEKLKEWSIESNDKGLPIPLLRDNKTGKGSSTLTMFWIAFVVSILALAGKISGLAGGIDYNSVLWLLGITGSFYLGRKMSGDGKKIEIEGKE